MLKLPVDISSINDNNKSPLGSPRRSPLHSPMHSPRSRRNVPHRDTPPPPHDMFHTLDTLAYEHPVEVEAETNRLVREQVEHEDVFDELHVPHNNIDINDNDNSTTNNDNPNAEHETAAHQIFGDHENDFYAPLDAAHRVHNALEHAHDNDNDNDIVNNNNNNNETNGNQTSGNKTSGKVLAVEHVDEEADVVNQQPQQSFLALFWNMVTVPFIQGVFGGIAVCVVHNFMFRGQRR